MKQLAVLCLSVILATSLQSQNARWQQRIYYQMDIDFDVKDHRFSGTQKIVYQNNSPDVLNKVYYHLYFNAFQPGSTMDVRSTSLPDPDRRVGDRISKLTTDQIGYHKIKSLKMNGLPAQYEVVETILEVRLPEPILPNSSAIFDMEFESQVPVQIRRSGRDNAEGIAYSMAQWYPKMCEYDHQGWHANPYVAREFYGVWGDFEVKIAIDEDYVVAASGYLQNPNEIGHGYETEGSKVDRPRGRKLFWHFLAPNVHDFVWAADPDYTHEKLQRKDGLTLHFFYQKNDKTKDVWAKLPALTDRAFDICNEKLGVYPYQQYSFIQGGDGGMEYPMATLITGERPLNSLVGVSLHEMIHSWYQMALGTNESLYHWMDEGFTNWAETEVMEQLKKEGLVPGSVEKFPHEGTLNGYRNFLNKQKEEAPAIHADHFTTNAAYYMASYGKGEIFLEQIRYIIGDEPFFKGMLRYYDEWKFKHPEPNDFIRIMEKTADLELDWFKEYFVNTTQTVDYGIQSVSNEEGKAKITLQKYDVAPMPVDLLVTYENGDRELLNIPLDLMRGSKKQEDKSLNFRVLRDWQWTNSTYEIQLKNPVVNLEIDPSRRLVDVNLQNNVWAKN